MSTTYTSRVSQSPHEGLGNEINPSQFLISAASLPSIVTRLSSFMSRSHLPINLPTPPFHPYRWSSLIASLPKSGEQRAEADRRNDRRRAGTKTKSSSSLRLSCQKIVSTVVYLDCSGVTCMSHWVYQEPPAWGLTAGTP